MKRTIIAVLCGGIVLQGSVIAQQQPGQQRQNQPGQRQQTPPGTQPGARDVGRPGGAADVAGERHHGMMHTGSILRTTQMVGMPVQSNDGKQIGQVRDLVIDPQTGRVEFALLSVSSMPGAIDTQRPGAVDTQRETQRPGAIGAVATDKMVPVPWQLLRSGPSATAGIGARPGVGGARETPPASATVATLGPQHFLFTGDVSKLQGAPTVGLTDLNQLQQENFGQRVYTHFGLDWNNRDVGGPGAGTSTERGIGTRPGTDHPGVDRTRPGTPRTPTSPDLRPGTPDNRNPGTQTPGRPDNRTPGTVNPTNPDTATPGQPGTPRAR